MSAALRLLLSSVGDRFGSYASFNGFIGNPGVYVDRVPEPGSLLLLLTGSVAALGSRQRS